MLAITMMVAFCVLAPLGDGLAKLLIVAISVMQIMLVRHIAYPVLLLPIMWARGQSLAMSRKMFGFALLRTVLQMAAMGMMILSLRYLPLADAIAIIYVLPFITLLLGHYVLSEEVGARRLIACIVGFFGTMLVVQPRFAEVGLVALLPLGSALSIAFFLLVTRFIAKDADPVALQTVTGLAGTPVFAAIILFVPGFEWQAMTGTQWAILLGASLIGTVTHLLLTWAMRYAPSATLAPVQYLEIPFATLIGFMLFSEYPNGLAAVGILITLASGLYLLHRERTLAQIAP
jgi:drug/metabolite transporter (DMT)-like permease